MAQLTVDVYRFVEVQDVLLGLLRCLHTLVDPYPAYGFRKNMATLLALMALLVDKSFLVSLDRIIQLDVQSVQVIPDSSCVFVYLGHLAPTYLIQLLQTSLASAAFLALDFSFDAS